MAAKLGFEAIEYVLKKALTKKGVRGIPTIPGPAYKMRMKQLVDEMAKRMSKIGYDVNNVTEKQVQGLLNYAEAMEKQKLKKGLEGLGKKKDPFMGFTPRIVPEEVTASPDRIRRGFSTVMKLNRPEENQALIKSFMRRENAEFNSLNREQQKEIFDMFDTWAKRDIKPDPADFASGGIAGGLIKLAKLKKMFPRIHIDSLLEASRIKDPNKLKQLLNSFRKTEQSIDAAPSSKLFDFDTTGRRPNASGGIAGQLHLHRPGYKGGALVKLLNLLKGSGKKTYYRGEPLIKNLEEMKKLEEFLKENKLKNTIMPETFRGRWFTNKKDIADIYANPEPGLNIIKKVELTPKEIEFGRKLLKKSKTGMEIFGTNIVLPKKKVKDIKTDVIATIMSNIKKPFVKKAEGGIAGELHLNQGGRARYATGYAVAAPGQGGTGDINAAMNLIAGRMPGNSLTAQDAFLSGQNLMGTTPLPGIGKFMHDQFKDTTPDAKQAFIDKQMAADYDIDAMRDPFQAASTAEKTRENYSQYKARMLESLRKGHAGQKTATTDLQPGGGYSGVSREIPIEDYFQYMLADKQALGFHPETGEPLSDIEIRTGKLNPVSTNVPGTPIVPTGLTNADLLNSSITLPDGTTVSRGEPGYPGTTASTPVAGDKSLLSKVVEGAKGVGQDLLTLGSIPANYAAGLTGLPIGYTTQAMRDRVEELAKSKGTGEFTVGYDDLGMKSTIDPTSFGGIIPESGIPPSITDLAIGLTAGDVSGKVSPEGKVTYDPETLAYDFGQKDPMAKTETGVSLLDVINRGGLTGRRVYTPMTSTFGSQTTQLPSSGVSGVEQIARSSPVMERMAAAKARGLDERMGRTYAENIQAMADKRMLQAKGGRIGYESGREVLPQQEIYEEELEKRGGFTGDPLYYFLGPGIETLKYKWPRSLLKKMIDDYKDIPKERLPEDFGPGLGSGVNVDTPLRRYRKKKLSPMIRRKKRKTIEQEAAKGGLAKVLGV